MSKKILVFLFSLAFFMFPLAVSAISVPGINEPLLPCGFSGSPSCRFCHIFQLIANFFELFIYLLVFLAQLAIVVGAFYLLMSGGRPEWVNRGKTAIWGAIWGLVISLLAWVIINTLIFFLVNQSAWPWWPWNEYPGCS